MKTLQACAAMTVLLMTVLCSGTLLAQQQDQPKPLRVDFTLFAGYRTIMSIPIEPHVSGTNPSIVLDAGPSYGGSVGYWIRENDLVELRWARQSSRARLEDVAPQPPRQRLVINQFHGDFSHEYLVDNWAQWARPFVLGSVGATHVSGVNNLNFTRFSFGIGGGIRFYPTRHLGFKIQAEWLPVVIDPQVAFLCGPGCVVNVRATLASQAEVIIGPVLRF